MWSPAAPTHLAVPHAPLIPLLLMLPTVTLQLLTLWQTVCSLLVSGSLPLSSVSEQAAASGNVPYRHWLHFPHVFAGLLGVLPCVSTQICPLN